MGGTSGIDMLRCLLCFSMVYNLQMIENEAAYMYHPRRSDFAECELNQEDKEQFLDFHNKLRGIVKPTAADMEYLVTKNNCKLSIVKAPMYCTIFHGLNAVAKQIASIPLTRCNELTAIFYTIFGLEIATKRSSFSRQLGEFICKKK